VCPIRGLDPSRNRQISGLGDTVRKILIERPTGILVIVRPMREGTYRSVKDEFRSFEEMEIPNSDDPIWIIGSARVLVVRSYHQFGELMSDLAILTSYT
jgi:hypothetical protein